MTDNKYTFLCSATQVLAGPYLLGDITGQAQGQRWCREVLGVTDLYAVRAETAERAAGVLRSARTISKQPS